MDDVIKVNKGLYPILPLRDIVVYPNMVVPLFCWQRKINTSTRGGHE